MARVLVIDDDPYVRSMLKARLEKDGHRVEVACDGNSGTRICRDGEFDVAIVDIIMPDKEGLETIRDLRRDSREVKIIAISGGGKGDPRDYLLMAKGFGAAYAFEKPIDHQRLEAALRELAG